MTADRSADADRLIDLHCEAHTYPDGTVGMHEVDFTVYPDEVVALVGGNGAGKSTVLEHLNATLVPDEGELVVDGTPITETNTAHARREVGFVFQDADTQLVAPTVLDDVMFGLRNHGVPHDEAEQRARDALARVDATHLVDRVPHYLSGGGRSDSSASPAFSFSTRASSSWTNLSPGSTPNGRGWSPTASGRSTRRGPAWSCPRTTSSSPPISPIASA